MSMSNYTEEDTYKALMGWRRQRAQLQAEMYPVTRQTIYVLNFSFQGADCKQTFAEADVPVAFRNYMLSPTTVEIEVSYEGGARFINAK